MPTICLHCWFTIQPDDDVRSVPDPRTPGGRVTVHSQELCDLLITHTNTEIPNATT